MSTKNIALDTRVYEELVTVKRESESFSKAIERVLRQNRKAHTGKDVLSGLAEMSFLSKRDAASMLKTIREGRVAERWPMHDLR